MSRNRNIFARFEDVLSGVFEGAVGRVFRTRLQPVELTRRLERAMDENLTVSPNRRVAPNAYNVLISEVDYARFLQSMQSLMKTLQDGLVSYARQRGYVLTTRPVVKLQVDQRLVTGEARCEARFLDSTQLAQFAGVGGTRPPDATATPSGQLSPYPGQPGASPDSTQLFGGGPPVAQPLPGSVIAPAELPYAALVMRTSQGPGKTYPMNREVIHIGRHTSNDIVINDRRVSRYHAEIRYEQGQFKLYDLGSLNGILINGSAQHQWTLRSGDIINFGNYSFVFERR